MLCKLTKVCIFNKSNDVSTFLKRSLSGRPGARPRNVETSYDETLRHILS